MADVGRDLTISSQQDSDRFDSRQSSVSGGASFSFGSMSGSASLSVSQDKMHSNYDSVIEQSGIFAGDGGFDITVGKHTGGAIGIGKTAAEASAAKAEAVAANAAKNGGNGSSINAIKNAAETQVSVDHKLANYLLDKQHPAGGSKAEWFDSALGFNKTNSDELAKQIVFDSGKAVKTAETQFGTKYDQVIPITGTNGRTINVKFSWIENNDGVVRLVTAIPAKK